MVQFKKGGAHEFNCEGVRLDPDDLVELEAIVRSDKLPETSGFFFGQSEPEDKICDLEFIEKAKKAIAEGKNIYYVSWW